MKGILLNEGYRNEVIVSEIEHHSIINVCDFLSKKGIEIKYVSVNSNGTINVEHLKKLITVNTALVSIMSANNEIGTIQPIKEIGRICSENNILFHTDAVQAVCNIPIDVKENNIDILSMSAHKFHGPKGIGCIYIKNGVKIDNFIHGGHQELGRRAGTESVSLILGINHAMDISMQNMNINNLIKEKTSKAFIKTMNQSNKDFIVNGLPVGICRLSGNINISFKNKNGSQIAFLLSKKGIYVSTGSACNVHKEEASHVLKAIGVPNEYINGTIRITM